ncbi:MAG: hypothetical protein ACI81V_000156 [Lentimonas sp.]|jgi:hypothetical protein
MLINYWLTFVPTRIISRSGRNGWFGVGGGCRIGRQADERWLQFTFQS